VGAEEPNPKPKGAREDEVTETTLTDKNGNIWNTQCSQYRKIAWKNP
jgi:hypothetical protein